MTNGFNHETVMIFCFDLFSRKPRVYILAMLELPDEDGEVVDEDEDSSLALPD